MRHTPEYTTDVDVRLRGVLPVYVRGVANGKTFAHRTIADRAGWGGADLQLPRALMPGTNVFTLMRLPDGTALAARGLVLYAEEKDHGLTRMTVRFTRTRLLLSSPLLDTRLPNINFMLATTAGQVGMPSDYPRGRH